MRFLREAVITAHLDHPGIVPIYDAGRWLDGTPFYTMKLITGRLLKELIQECTSIDQRLALVPHVIAVADAIAYAHARKIIHRDIKPSNVMVGELGETIVIDWGLSKVIADVSDGIGSVVGSGSSPAPAGDGVTIVGTVLGTPAFMAPEQARGEPVDERADVYAIGAMLECIFSGEALSGGAGQASPQAKSSAPPGLAAIIARAMAPERACRYRNASALAAALRAFATGPRTAARPSRLAVGTWMRWTRTMATAMAAALALSIALAACGAREIPAERRADQANHAVGSDPR